MPITRIIEEYPGYYWELDEDQQWMLRWQPVHGWYSPPRLHPGVTKYDVHLPLYLQDKIGLLVGRKGSNFIRITNESGCYYIFYRSTSNTIEIWGEPSSIHYAYQGLEKLMTRVWYMSQA